MQILGSAAYLWELGSPADIALKKQRKLQTPLAPPIDVLVDHVDCEAPPMLQDLQSLWKESSLEEIDVGTECSEMVSIREHLQIGSWSILQQSGILKTASRRNPPLMRNQCCPI